MPWQFNPTSDATRLNKYIDEMTDHPAKKGPVYLSRLGESTIKKGTCVRFANCTDAGCFARRGGSRPWFLKWGQAACLRCRGRQEKSRRTRREK